MSRVTRTVAARTNPHSRRCASATAVATCAASTQAECLLVEDHDRADLETRAGSDHRNLAGHLDRLVEIRGLDQVVAAQGFLGLDERAVGGGEPAGPVVAQRGRGG